MNTVALPSQDVVTKAIEWYFQYAPGREGTPYALPAGTWLDRLFTLRKSLDRLARSEKQTKAALALWGPSQTGKSTFLTNFIDGLADPAGNNSAIDWGKPWRFSIEKRLDGVRSLNPYNMRSDASGCITRFVLGDKATVDPEHPVRLRLVQPAQLLHALAAGYCTECEGTVGDGGTVHWDAARVTQLLQRYNQPRSIHPSTYRFLHDVCDVLELLQQSFLDRYSDLRPGWKKLRESILQTPGLHGNRDHAMEFASTLFWDGAPALTRAFGDLYKMLQTIRTLAGGTGEPQLRCSLDVAAVLLDIASYAKICSGEAAGEKPKDAYEIRWRPGSPGQMVLSHGTGNSLLQNTAEFGFLQGVVQEIVVPLRPDIIEQTSKQLYTLLTHADLLDFPGVARQDRNVEEARLKEAELAKGEKSHLIYTQVVKRGRTSSIVVSNASNYDIDGFSILNKIIDFPSKPEQLSAGISVWWQSLTGEAFKDATAKTLPLNLIHTFCGEMINDLIRNGPGHVRGTLKKIEGLGKLSDPAVTSSFATNYHKFVPLRNTAEDRPASEAEKQEQLEGLLKDRDYQRQFLDGNFRRPGEERHRSLDEMIYQEDGGTEYMLSKLVLDAQLSPRRQLLAKRKQSLSGLWQLCLEEALPAGGDGALRRAQQLERWSQGLRDRLKELHARNRHEDGAQKVSYRLRQFLNVNPKHLEPLPRGLKDQPPDMAEEHLKMQISLWQESRRGFSDYDEIGLTDETHSRQVVGHLADALDLWHLANWLTVNFNDIQSQEKADGAKSFLAVQLTSALTGYRPYRTPHTPAGDKLVADLFEMAQAETDATAQARPAYERSPHYTAYLSPFLEHLEELKHVQQDKRGILEGDQELLELVTPAESAQ